MTRLLLLSFLLALPTTVDAQTHPPQCSKTDPKDCVQPLLEGESAPFSGQLLTNRRAAKLAVKADQCGERVQLAIEETLAKAALDLQLEKALRANDLEAWQQKEKLLTQAVQKPWWEHPVVVATITVIATSAVYWGAVEVVKATK